MFDFLRQEYAAARLRAMKGGLIDKAKFSKLGKAKSISEIANILENTDYESVFYHGIGKDIMEIESGLDRIFVGLLERVKGFYYGKERNVIDMFLREWEMRNLKLLIKSIVVGEDWSGFLVPLKGFDLEHLSKSGNVEELISKLKKTGYYESLYSGYKNIEEFGLPVIDFHLESAYSRMFLEGLKEIKEKELLVSYLRKRNDLINLRNVSRAIVFKKDLSRFFIEPSNVKKEWFRLGSLEALMEKMKSKGFDVKDIGSLEEDVFFELALGRGMERLVSRFLNVSPFDTGLLLFYLVMKRNEINRIKIITRFVKEGLDREDLNMLLGSGE